MKWFLILLALSFAVPAFAECDCQWYAYWALRKVGLKLKTFPAVVASSEYGGRGWYLRGVVGVPDITNCKTMTHEFVHHYQNQQGWLSEDRSVWDLNERDAKIITQQAVSAHGPCELRFEVE